MPRQPERPIVLYVHNGTDLYGASRSLLRLVSRTSAVRPHVVVPGEGALNDALRDVGVPVSVLPSLAVLTRGLGRPTAATKFGWRIWTSARDLAGLARRVGADLLHTNVGIIASAGLAARLTKRPHVWHIRDSFRDFPMLWRPYSQYVLSTSDAVVCVSRSVAEQFPQNHPKVSVVHNGLPLDEFPIVSSGRIRAFKQRFGLASFRTVGVVGRVKVQRKGQDFFLRGAARIAAQFPDVRFVIIGSAFPGNESHMDEIKALTADLGLSDKVIMTGDVDDIQAAITSLDALVMASCEPEPFAGVVMESMALGVPVIGTAIGGTTEQITHGLTGLLIPPNDVDALAAALDTILHDGALRSEFAANGRLRVQREFGFDRMHAQLDEIYHSCLDPTAIPRLATGSVR